MYSQWEYITPATANEDLKTARCGRSPSMGVIERYARDMAAGGWVPSPEPVVYSADEAGTRTLRDGQQRYYGIVRAALSLAEQGKIGHPDDFSLRLWVTTGSEQEIGLAFPYLNIGKNRTGTDYLTVEGRKNPTMLHTVARRVVMWEAGHASGNSYKPTRREVLAALTPDPGKDQAEELARIARIEDAAEFAANWKLRPPIPQAGTAGFLWWLLGCVSSGQRDVFLEYLRTGTGLEEDVPDGEMHPLAVLRNRLHGDYYEARRRGANMKPETVLYLCLRTWEHWRRHEWPKKLQMPQGLTDAHFRKPR